MKRIFRDVTLVLVDDSTTVLYITIWVGFAFIVGAIWGAIGKSRIYYIFEV